MDQQSGHYIQITFIYLISFVKKVAINSKEPTPENMPETFFPTPYPIKAKPVYQKEPLASLQGENIHQKRPTFFPFINCL